MNRDPFKEYPVSVSYQNIRDKLDTGDIVIFGGQYRMSKMIRLVTRFPASHVALIIREDC